MRFKEVYEGCECKRLTQSEAVMLLGVCDRMFKFVGNCFTSKPFFNELGSLIRLA